MDIKETMRKLLQETVVPDLAKIKEENGKILALLGLTNKRLDDINIHMADQSRRIDEVRSELAQRIDETNKRIDEVRSDLTQAIDDVRSGLTQAIDDVRSGLTQRIDETNTRIDEVRSDLTQQMQAVHSDLIRRLDGSNARIDLFFQNSVSKSEYHGLEKRLSSVEYELGDIRQRIAA